jgi:hypothetical protein
MVEYGPSITSIYSESSKLLEFPPYKGLNSDKNQSVIDFIVS